MGRTLRDLLVHLDSQCFRGNAHLRWPPDTFCLAAYALRHSGAYVHVLESWPPEVRPAGARTDQSWLEWIEDVGARWRASAAGLNAPPPEIRALWEPVRSAADVPAGDLREHRDLSCALLQLVLAADEACAGVDNC
jgi:hypothetical protein